MLDGLHPLSVDLFDDYLGAGNRELISLPAHGLDEDGEVELAAAADHELIGGPGLFDAQPEVEVELSQKPGTQLS